ncbi:caspase family protein [Corallococcus llansteffanensis]|uniref:caspase family protein n=1 Tax=Corallococcus llansteffanensis TaxID=2316731 RepID=UPI0011C4AC4E|nr:caspase family protein [Corallococcus llansteffanensis]
MKTRALVVGIDDYRFQPLTSAVNDAQAFARALATLGLVAPADITLLTAPGTGATMEQLLEALDHVYRHGATLDRFYFFFAGHGLLAFSNASRTQTRTALVASDARGIEDGRKLLDLDELRDKLQLAGPQEQFYFIDACRDLDYEIQPEVSAMGFSGVAPGAARTQATLFAVSPLGKARGRRGGHGVMTTHLLEALRGEGVATDFDADEDQFVVTFQSLHAHVLARVLHALQEEPLWSRKYNAPEVAFRGPLPRPLRIIEAVPDAPLTIHIEPDQAAAQTKIEVALRRMPLKEMCLPPRGNHDTLLLKPHRYSIRVDSAHGTPEPTRTTVDVRSTRELTVRITGSAGAPQSSQNTAGEPVERIAQALAAAPGTGTLSAWTEEPTAMIRVVGLEPPYLVQEARERLEASLPCGPYRVTFRLGLEVFGTRDIYILAHQRVDLHPDALHSPLVREAIPPMGDRVMPSEIVGPMQAAVLPTLLPLIALKSFDRNNTFLRRKPELINSWALAHRGQSPFAVMVALDGDWKRDPSMLLRRIRVLPCDGFEGHANGSGLKLKLLPGPNTLMGSPGAPGTGFDRIGMLLARGTSSFSIQIHAGALGTLQVACAGQPQRLTVISLTLRPDGTFDLSQNLLRIPDVTYQEPVLDLPYPRLVRALQLGQQLYASGELLDTGRCNDHLRELLDAKWVDPLLGCMAYLAEHRRASNDPAWQDQQHAAARNLQTYFGDLPDVRLIQSLDSGHFDGASWEGSHSPAIPVLADSLRELVRLGSDTWPLVGKYEHLLRRIQPHQPWTCFWI